MCVDFWYKHCTTKKVLFNTIKLKALERGGKSLLIHNKSNLINYIYFVRFIDKQDKLFQKIAFAFDYKYKLHMYTQWRVRIF